MIQDLKKILLISSLCFTCVMVVNAQNGENNNSFAYEEVVTSDLSKVVLWINLKKWISSSFSSYQHVVDMEDKEAGVLMIKWTSSLQYPVSTNWSTQYEATYQIDVRDGKYRIKIYNTCARIEPDYKNMKNKSIADLNVAQREIGLAMEIGNSLCQSQIWPLDDHYIHVMNNEARFTIVMNAVKEGYEEFNNILLDSLKSAMAVKDDF